MYLTYEAYRNMGGTLDETTFNDFEYEAETLINWYTFNRFKNDSVYPEEVNRCMYKLIQMVKLEADLLFSTQRTEVTESSTSGDFPAIVYTDVPEGSHTETTTVTTSPMIQSESNDGVSVSYNTISASELFDKLTSKEKGNTIEKIIQRYLQGVTNSLGQKVLYRGVYPNE